MAFVFLILVFFIDHYCVCVGGGGGYLINSACPFFHLIFSFHFAFIDIYKIILKTFHNDRRKTWKIMTDTCQLSQMPGIARTGESQGHPSMCNYYGDLNLE